MAGFPQLVVPAVVRPHVSERVLVLERVRGGKVAPGHGLPPERAYELARAFFRAYVRQVCVQGVYHADPHRGNVLLTDDGRLALLDFGRPAAVNPAVQDPAAAELRSHVEHVLRTVPNRVGAAMIVVGLLIASALMARVSDVVALAGFSLSGVIGLYMNLEDRPYPGRVLACL